VKHLGSTNHRLIEDEIRRWRSACHGGSNGAL
jgi:hypothetical protein